jgi:hypothetical protein
MSNSRDYPMLNERARGWLRFLHRKAITPDDWSSTGEPHEWWDTLSYPPVANFHRFDLEMSSFAVPMMADATPAWREVYTDIMDKLLERHITYRAAIDWITQIGHDPERADYPPNWVNIWIPEELWGKYDRPGWTANGVAPFGLQPDPVGAEGNLFFKGWLNTMLGTYAYVSGDDKWHRPFWVTGVGDEQFQWAHGAVNDLLTQQWTDHPEGPHCENTKIWPLCLSGAGLGLKMHDNLYGTNVHWVYRRWVEIAKERFMSITDGGHVEWMALYYDPDIDLLHKCAPMAWLTTSLFGLPQDFQFAEIIYRSAVEQIGWRDSKRDIETPFDPRPVCIGMVLAREFGDEITFARLRDYAERHFEPTFFGPDLGDFGWHFGFGERYPRGQLSGIMMMQEVGEPGAWRRVYEAPNLRKFNEPTVNGVDFPHFGLSQAYFDGDESLLAVTTYVGSASHTGRSTSLKVSNLSQPESCTIRCDGQAFGRWGVVSPDTIQLDLDITEHRIEVFVNQSRGSSAHVETRHLERPAWSPSATGLAGNRGTSGVRTSAVRTPRSDLVSSPVAGGCADACCGTVRFG